MMTCLVETLAREYRRLWDASCGMDDQSEEFDQAVDAMSACRLLASHHTPTSEEGWAFLSYILVWYDGGRCNRDEFLLVNRVSEMIENRHYTWGAAAQSAEQAAA
jgi:hypothetical protein